MNYRLGHLFVQGVDDHVCATRGQSQSDRSPDPTPSPSDKRDPRAGLRHQNDRGSPNDSAMELRAISFVIGPMRNSRLSRQYRCASVSAA